MKHFQSSASQREPIPPPQKWACLNCRVITKMPHNFKPQAPPSCSRCCNRIFFAGKAFRVPRRSDEKAWRKVALMLRAGYMFRPDAFRVPVPDNPNALADWERRSREEAQRLQGCDSEQRWEEARRRTKRRFKMKRLVAEAREAERRNREAAASTCRPQTT